jgi:hypothetical protein
VLSACAETREEAAEALVRQYVALDTSGQNNLADSTLLPNCEHDLGADFIAPVVRVTFLPAGDRGDTVEVPVVYETLGYLADQSLWDKTGARTRVSAFRPNFKIDTTRFLVVARSIVCPNFLAANRHGLQYLRDWIPTLDSMSKRAWDSTLVAHALQP